jgi:hypothetical protein
VRSRWTVVAFVGVILFGAALRLVRLRTYPPGLFFDEAANLFDIANVLNGARPIYFPANNGREPFFFYWASLFASYLGNTPYSLRLSGAMIGILTLPATFLCAREFARAWDRDRRWSDGVAIAATFVLAITYFHLHYSRYGLRTITLPLFLALCYGFLMRALRRRSWLAATAAGLSGGLSTYTYIASRVAPFLLLVPLGFGLLDRSRRYLLPLTLWVGLLWAVASVPLGVYYLRHPQSVEGHTDDVSMLNPVNNGGDPAGAILHGVILTLGAFDVRGSLASDQNLAGRPILDPMQSVFFAAGLVVLAGAVLRPRQVSRVDSSNSADSDASGSMRPLVALVLVTWILDQAAPSALSVSPPGYVRLTGTLPAVAIIVAIGLGSIYRALVARLKTERAIASALAATLLVSTVWTIRDYFFVWGPSEEAYNWMMAPKVDASRYLNQISATDRVFLAPLWATDYTVKFMTSGTAVQSFDLGQSLVLPTDRSRGVRYLFPASDAQEAAQVAAELPGHPVATTVRDPTDRYPILLELRVPPSDLLLPPPAMAAFADGIGLAGATISPSIVASGKPVEINLEWLSQRPASDDYTIFIHVRDATNKTIAQADGRPGAGSYPTNAWRPGDIVWDRHVMTLPPSAPPGKYTVVVGMYRLATLKRLEATDASGRATDDEVTIGQLDVSSP